MNRPTVLLRVDDVLDTRSRSGIHRVIVELARSLPRHATTHFVRWDDVEGHLRPIDRTEFDVLFGVGQWPRCAGPNPGARRTAYRFDELVDCSGDTWLVNPDVPMHTPEALARLSRASTQCREYGARIASIFYDLIPATNPEYAIHKAGYLAYLTEIVRADLLLPISQYSADRLKAFLEANSPSAAMIPMHPVPLAEISALARAPSAPAQAEGMIVLLGTVEPRKRQVQVLQAYAAARQVSPALAGFEVYVVGSLHPSVANEFRELVRRTPNVHYLDYLADAAIQRLLARAAFTVFASDDEGFGLPIAESLAAGVPCLCANFGAMAEVGTGGGCYSVDVRDPAALRAALIELAENPRRLDHLRTEIGSRRFRRWEDYARSFVEALELLPSESGPDVCLVELGERDTIAGGDVAQAARADVVLCSSSSVMDAVIEAAEHASSPMLPSRWHMATERAAARQSALQLSAYRGRLQRIADAEKRSLATWRAFDRQIAGSSKPLLRIVVTTYNRREFVQENVRWLTKITKGRPGVELMVVDNASTDGTAEALRAEFGEKLNLLVNPANVGMLGNIRVCSQQFGAPYVWVIGDDDFIVAERLDSIIASLRAHAGVPIAAINFAVYHRERLGPTDRAESLIAEQVPLAPDPAPSGVVPLTVAASQHDNLFTAIYGVIWRHDVLSAAYDHPFRGQPFESLIESIPCTKTLLESFAACDVLWIHPVGIVGNAHNSWTRHRPRWHGRLMADALALASDAGVDRQRLAGWARLQAELYEEAVTIARRDGLSLNMSNPEDFSLSWPIFRRRITGEQT